MSPDGGRHNRERLAALIEARQEELGVPWTQVIETSGLGKEGLRKIRRAITRNPRVQHRRGLERALRWALGSVDRVLAGGDPIPLPAADSTAADVLSTSDMVAEAHRDLDRLAALREELRQRIDAAEQNPKDLERAVKALRLVQDEPEQNGLE